MGFGLIARGVIWPAGKNKRTSRGVGVSIFNRSGASFVQKGEDEILDSSLSVGYLFLAVDGIEP